MSMRHGLGLLQRSSRLLIATLGLAILFTLLLINVGAAPRPVNGAVVPDRYIVVLRDGADANTLAKAHGLSVERHYGAAVHGFVAKGAPGLLEKLQQDPAVASVEPDRYVVLDVQRPTITARRKAGTTSPQRLPTGVNRIDADLSAAADIDGLDDSRVNVDVAIIDTGVQTNHPDLRVLGGKDCTGSGGYGDGHGHGTHVAGTVAAIDNGYGVVGVAPGARVWSVRVLNSQGWGYLSWIVCGIDYVTANAGTIEVANMSLGFEGSDGAINTAISNSVAKGVVYAVAAGNSSKDVSTFSPASHPDVISVSAVADFNGAGGGGGASTCWNMPDDSFATFSNYGQGIEIGAPGVCIYSTYKGSSYATMSGTSMASPHVTGAAALYVASHGRDLNGDGLVNRTDAQMVRSALMAAGKAQSDTAYGFTGDPDSYHERMLYVGGF